MLDPSAKDKKNTIPQGSKPNQEPEVVDENDEEAVDPTRYGDWEQSGRCIDF